MKKSTLLKTFLTGLLLVVLLFKVSVLDIFNIIFSVDLVFLAGTFPLVAIMIILRTWRWNLFLTSVGIDLPFFQALKVLLIGNFYGLITPGHIGELGRAYHLDEKKVISVPTIVLEKIIDICTLVGLCLLTTLVYFPENSIMIIIIILCSITVPTGIFLLTNKKIVQYIARIFRIGKEESEQFSDIFRRLVTNYPVIGFSFLISMLYYGVAYILGYLIIVSAGFNPVVFITLPIIVLMGNIPLTIAGLGLRESVGSIAFIYLGENAANGFVFAFLLFILITLLPALIGYALVMRGGGVPEKKAGQTTGLLSQYLESRRTGIISGIVTGGSILDFGCGRGNMIPSLTFIKYTGTDLDRAVVSESKKEYSHIKNVFFYTLDEFENIQEKYDFIILSAVIEHFSDPIKTMNALRMRLQDEGKIVITTPTPFGNHLLKIGSMFGIFSRCAFEQHNQIFSKYDFIKFSKKLNLKIIKYDTFEIGMNQVVVLSHEE